MSFLGTLGGTSWNHDFGGSCTFRGSALKRFEDCVESGLTIFRTGVSSRIVSNGSNGSNGSDVVLVSRVVDRFDTVDIRGKLACCIASPRMGLSRNSTSD